jgi:outer membrane protein assembly factor BamB
LLAACGRTANPEGWAAPVFDGDVAYVFLDDHHLTAVQLEGNSATALWVFPDDDLEAEKDIELDGVYTEPIVDGDLIYVGAYEGEVYALGRDDGRLRWATDDQLNIKGSIVGGPTLDGETLVFGTTDGYLYRIQAADGSPAPGWPAGGVNLSKKGIWAPPVVRDGVAYLATMNGEVHAVDLASGDEVWTEPFDGESGAIADIAALNDSGRLFVPTLGRSVFIVDSESGAAIGAATPANDWVWTRPAVSATTAFYGDFSGELFALNIATGALEWTASTDGRVKGGPAVVGDFVVFVDESPAVIFVNRESGEIRNRVPLDDAGTIRAGVTEREGMAFVVSTNGKLFRADPSNFSVVEIPVVGRNQ